MANISLAFEPNSLLLYGGSFRKQDCTYPGGMN